MIYKSQIVNSTGRINQEPQELELATCSLSGSSLNSSIEENVPHLFLAIGNGMSPGLGTSLSSSSMTSSKQMSRYITNILEYGLSTNQVEISLSLITHLKSYSKFGSSLISSLSLVSRSLSHSGHVAKLLLLCIRDKELLGSLEHNLHFLIVNVIIFWLSLVGDPVVGSVLVKDCRDIVNEVGREIRKKFSDGFQLVLEEVKSILISGRGGATIRTGILDILVDMVKQEVDETKDDVNIKEPKSTDGSIYVSLESEDTKLIRENSKFFQGCETSDIFYKNKPVLLKPKELEDGLVQHFVDNAVIMEQSKETSFEYIAKQNKNDAKETGDTDDSKYLSMELDETKLNHENSQLFQEIKISVNVDQNKSTLFQSKELEDGLVRNLVGNAIIKEKSEESSCTFFSKSNDNLSKISKKVGDILNQVNGKYNEDHKLHFEVVKEKDKSAEDIEFESLSEEDDELLPFNYILNKDINTKESCEELIQEEYICSTVDNINEDENIISPTSPPILGHFIVHGQEDFYPVVDNSSIGRSKECQVCLPGKEVSKVHATVHLVDGRVYIEARSMTNPLKVNSQLLAKGSRIELNNGDIMRVGRMKLVWSSEDRTTSRVPGEEPDSTMYYDSPEV